MPTTLLKTKLYMPPLRHGLVARPRLIDKLNQSAAEGHRLTLIAAAAGYGKTTLISEWLACRQHSAAWLALDPDDNDPVRFWTYVLAALQTAHTGALDPLLNDLTEAQPPPLDVLLPDMVNQLAALNERLVLVLDDYHVIESEQVHASFTFLLDHLPPNLQLVISTRADPPFPLHRWRARNQLTEVRTADLRFTLAEAASFLNERMGLNLTPADVQKLEERTEGWAIGLQLAALSMQGCQDPSTFIARFSRGHHFVIEYLTGEVLSQQSEAVQSFILKTSLLDRFCAPLCQAVTDQTDSSAILKSPSPQVVYRERAG